MAEQLVHPIVNRPAQTLRTLAALGASLMVSACAGGLGAGLGDQARTDQLSETPQQHASGGGPVDNQSEIEKATAYWGKEFGKNPRNLDAALAFAKNLKAMGQKQQALSVLQQASLYHAQDKKLASEYGRLALEFDQLSVATALLEAADDPTAPDWKVVSARGTLLAKQGKYKEAIPFYERAMTLAHDHPSITNNLAMAYAMSGEAGKAEVLLRRAAELDGTNPKVQQNLAIVLGLQGKHDEAKSTTAGAATAENVAYNADLLRKVVRPAPADTGNASVQQAKVEPKAKAKPKPDAATIQQAKATAPALKPATSDPVTRPNAAAVLADSYAEPVFKPSTR